MFLNNEVIVLIDSAYDGFTWDYTPVFGIQKNRTVQKAGDYYL
jgi:hypothetical protein